MESVTSIGVYINMEAIIIIGTFAFILGYRYINYLRDYMHIRFGIKEKK